MLNGTTDIEKRAGSETNHYLDRHSDWMFFGEKCPKAEIVFFSQVILVYIVVITSIVNLSINNGSDRLWIALLSSSIGYLLPNPRLQR